LGTVLPEDPIFLCSVCRKCLPDVIQAFMDETPAWTLTTTDRHCRKFVGIINERERSGRQYGKEKGLGFYEHRVPIIITFGWLYILSSNLPFPVSFGLGGGSIASSSLSFVVGMGTSTS